MEDLQRVHDQIADYYTHKITTYGATPMGVDWSCTPTQDMRFVQLLKVCTDDLQHNAGNAMAPPLTLNDVGCGYGALLALLKKRHPKARVDYLGTDLSGAMVAQAQKHWKRRALGGITAAFAEATTRPRTADYAVASGIFNVKLDQPTAPWEAFIRATLVDMHATSTRGFAVNFLTPSLAENAANAIPELYRAAPAQWQHYCEQTLGAQVELISGYGLREYTLLVRKGKSGDADGDKT